MIRRVFNLIILLAFGFCAQQLKLPVNICHRDATNYSTCLRDAIQEAWPRFVQGLPEFDFPILDPLFYDNHHAVYNNGEIHADIEAINITIIGFANFHFLFAKTHFADDVFRFETDIELPKLLIDGTVKIIGSIGPFKLNSTGHFNITPTDLKSRWIITGHVIDDKWIVERYHIIPTITGMKLYLTDFFDSQEFNDLIHEFVNEYWPALYRAMGPMIIDTWEPWHIQTANRLFSKISFSKLFPK